MHTNQRNGRWKASKEAALVVILSIVAAVTCFSTNSRINGDMIVDQATGISAHAVSMMQDVIWVDARIPSTDEKKVIPNAISLHENNWDALLPVIVEKMRPAINIVVFCDNAGCGLSRRVADRLRRELGYNNVFWLEGGIEAVTAHINR